MQHEYTFGNKNKALKNVFVQSSKLYYTHLLQLLLPFVISSCWW